MVSALSQASRQYRSTKEATSNQKRLIIDTDVGFDDISAIQTLLLERQQTNSNNGVGDDTISRPIDLITTVSGMSTSSYGALALRQLFPDYQHNIVASPDGQRPNVSWLSDARANFNKFVRDNKELQSARDVTAKDEGDTLPSSANDKNEAVQAMLELLQEQSSQPKSVDIVCLGPLSNVAQLLELLKEEEEELDKTINQVWIMGGNRPRHKNDDEPSLKAEFNFAQDPEAAAEVLGSQLLKKKIILVTADETEPQKLPHNFAHTIQSHILNSSGEQESFLARMILAETYSLYYDPICAFLYTNSSSASYEPVNVYVSHENGKVFWNNTSDCEGTAAGNCDTNNEISIAYDVQFEGKEGYQEWILNRLSMSN